MVFCTEFVDGWWSWEPLRRSCVRCGWCRATHQHRTHDLCSGSLDHHPSKNSVQKTICCNTTSNAPDDGAYVPETCRSKNTLIKSPCCIKLAFQIISITLIFSSVPKTLRTSTNVTLRHEFLRRSVSVAVPYSHAPPPWPLHMICNEVHVERPLGVKRFENRWVSPFCSCRAVSTELISLRPSLTSGVTILAIERAQACLVQLLYNDRVRRTDILTCPIIKCCFM